MQSRYLPIWDRSSAMSCQQVNNDEDERRFCLAMMNSLSFDSHLQVEVHSLRLDRVSTAVMPQVSSLSKQEQEGFLRRLG